MTLPQLLHDAFFAKDLPGAARVLETCPPDEIAEILAGARRIYIGRLLLRFPSCSIRRVLSSLPRQVVIEAMLALSPADAAALCRHLDSETRQEILELAPQSVANAILEFLDLPPDSAGRLMEIGGATCYEDQTVHDALEQLERLPNERSTEIIVLSRDQRVIGILSVLDLIGEARETPLASLPIHTTPLLRTTDKQEVVSQAFEAGTAVSLPVVDHQERFMGTIPYTRMFEPWKTELLTPWLAMLGVPGEEAQDSTLSSTMRSRLPWTGIHVVVIFLVTWLLSLVKPSPPESFDPATMGPMILLAPLSFGLQSLGATLRSLLAAAPTAFFLRTHLSREITIAAAHGGILALGLLLVMTSWIQSFPAAWPVSAAVWLTGLASSVAGVVFPWISKRLPIIPFHTVPIMLFVVTAVTGILSYVTLGSLSAG